MPQATSKRRPLVMVELNEFNAALLGECADLFGLKNIQRVLGMHRTHMFTEDTYESDFLEPWVQWVSIHTGTASKEHLVKHLGDVPALEFPQIWELLAKRGLKCNIWGVLNGAQGAHHRESIPVFLPDPWTFSEMALPQELNALLSLPRYAARNRVKPNFLKLAGLFFELGKFLLSKGRLFTLVQEFPAVTKQVLRHGISEYSAFCAVEYLSARLFIDYWKEHRPDFSILFLNSIAHLQHYYWEKDTVAQNERFRFGFSYVDRILGHLMAECGEHVEILVTNGLSQKNTNNETPWISYRPIDHEIFLKTAGCDFQSVEPLMSYDALIYFETAEKRQAAERILKEAKVVGKNLFLVESYLENPCKLFYRLQFTDIVAANELCLVNGQAIPFSKLFKKIIQRTGKHIPVAEAYSTWAGFPQRLENHQIFHELLNYFGISNTVSTHRSDMSL